MYIYIQRLFSIWLFNFRVEIGTIYHSFVIFRVYRKMVYLNIIILQSIIWEVAEFPKQFKLNLRKFQIGINWLMQWRKLFNKRALIKDRNWLDQIFLEYRVEENFPRQY